VEIHLLTRIFNDEVILMFVWSSDAIFEDLKLVLLKTPVVCDVTQCRLLIVAPVSNICGTIKT
jgi:hypothetical protein